MDRLETETIQKKGIILGSIRVQLANLEKSLGEVNKRIVKPIQNHLKQVQSSLGKVNVCIALTLHKSS